MRRDDGSVSRLRRWRLSAGLTLTEVGDLSGISATMLSRVERGERHLAPLTKVAMARRLGVAVGDLFEVAMLELDEVSS